MCKRSLCTGLTEVILTIFLLIFLSNMMSKRIDYYELSGEPIWNGSQQAVSGGKNYTQKIYCLQDKIYGVMGYIDTPADGSDVKMEVEVALYDGAGNCLAKAQKYLESGFTGYQEFMFQNPICGYQNQMIACEYKNSSNQKILLKGGDFSGTLCNETGNVCTRLIYRVLDVKKYKCFVYLSGAGIWLILSTVIFRLIKRQTKPEHLFAFLYLSLGMLYMAAVPLYAVPDEANHFLRAYAITEGKWVADQSENGVGGSMLPVNIVYNMKNGDMRLRDVADLAKVSLSKEKAFHLYGNTALYSPFTYTAQAAGIWLGKLVSSKAVFCAYCGRIVSWLAIGMILFFCIRYLPFGKHMLTAVSLLPMNMHESISLAGDGFTFSIVAAFLTFVLHARYRQKEAWSCKQYFLLYLLLFYLSSCKIVYVPFALTAFIIPRERFGNRKNYVRHVLCAGFMTATASACWLAVSSGFLVEFNPGVASARQVQFVLSHPMQYLITIARTILDRGGGMVMTMLGSSLGYLNVAVSRILIGTAAGCLVYMTVRERQAWMRERALWQRCLLLVSCGCSVLLIFTSLYVQWTPVGSGMVDGVQGRYFLPVLLPVLLALRGSRMRKKDVQQSYKYMQQLFNYADAAVYFVLLLTGILTAATCLTYYII